MAEYRDGFLDDDEQSFNGSFMNRLLDKLHQVFHEPKSASYKIMMPLIWIMILFSIFLFLIDISLPLDDDFKQILEWFDVAILIFFALEYIGRILSYRAPRFLLYNHSTASLLRHNVNERFKYALGSLNLIDLLTILGGSPELRGLRALRLLRLLRLLKGSTVFQYSNPIHEIFDSIHKNRLLYILSFSIVALSTIVGGLSIYLVENKITSIADGLWWAIVTLTTVGYGDISPESFLGRAVAATLMIVGMFTLALFAGVVSQTLLKSVLSIREEQFRMSTHMNHIIICNYEPSARMLLNTLMKEYDLEETQAVIFANMERPNDIPSEFEWQRGDPTKESELSKVRIAFSKACIIVGSRSVLPQLADAGTILTIFTIRSFVEKQKEYENRKKPIYIAAEILDSENIEHARTAGANEVIESTRVGFSLLSHAISQQGSAAVLSSIATLEDQNLFIGKCPPGVELPISFYDLSKFLQKTYAILLIGFKQETKHKINPAPETMMSSEYGLIYLSEKPQLLDFTPKI